MKFNGNTVLLALGGVAAGVVATQLFLNWVNQRDLDAFREAIANDGTPATDDQGVSQVSGGIQVIDGTWIEPLPNTPDPYQGYQDYRNGERMA